MDEVRSEGDGIGRAVTILDWHSEIAAIACAQAEADGSPWPPAMQPAAVSYPCRVPAHIGFAHILRRRAFFEVGGYRENLRCFGEEKDLGVRFLKAGYQVVYLPDLLVAHVSDPAGRNSTEYVRYVVRNDCLFALYNEPWLLWFVSLPLRLGRHFTMGRLHPLADLAGFVWTLSQLVGAFPRAMHRRSPMSWVELDSWRQLRRSPAPWCPRFLGCTVPVNRLQD